MERQPRTRNNGRVLEGWKFQTARLRDTSRGTNEGCTKECWNSSILRISCTGNWGVLEGQAFWNALFMGNGNSCSQIASLESVNQMFCYLISILSSCPQWGHFKVDSMGAVIGSHSSSSIEQPILLEIIISCFSFKLSPLSRVLINEG